MLELAVGFATVGVLGFMAGAFALGHAVGFVQGTRARDARAKNRGNNA